MKAVIIHRKLWQWWLRLVGVRVYVDIQNEALFRSLLKNAVGKSTWQIDRDTMEDVVHSVTKKAGMICSCKTCLRTRAGH